MRTTNLLIASGVALASAFVTGPSPSAAPGPQPVTITNTPVPVSGTVGLSGPVTATLSGTPTVSATITNTSTNPVPITDGDRPTSYHQLQIGSSSFSVPTKFAVPTGCRLVVQAVSYVIVDSAPTTHVPMVSVLTPANTDLVRHFITTQQTTLAGASFTVGTLAMQFFVDSPNAVGVRDFVNSEAAEISVSGYLVQITSGASC